ncbi:Cilia- and flagella-associated protein 20, variant 3 [Clonorchis sinensis]|uniref:Cilia- and flagella-associated protein 20, variant 3 n=1 Tax=Clonorchis sinensis TaxID=79923 RepID=A0A8T1M910_CLOSI|nr:Cilia- and flagella-associated protein 20, variant 3 [Clonorchis sinensis]
MNEDKLFVAVHISGMFRNTFQSGFLSVLFSVGTKPLQLWDKKVRNGHIKRITDSDIQSLVLELLGNNVSTTYISCPADPRKSLGIKLPFLVLIVKNLKKYFTFEIQILDDAGIKRRFRASNYQSTTRVKPFICTMPLRLDENWNNVFFNVADFTKRAYGTNFVEVLRIQRSKSVSKTLPEELKQPYSHCTESFIEEHHSRQRSGRGSNTLNTCNLI